MFTAKIVIVPWTGILALNLAGYSNITCSHEMLSYKPPGVEKPHEEISRARMFYGKNI